MNRGGRKRKDQIEGEGERKWVYRVRKGEKKMEIKREKEKGEMEMEFGVSIFTGEEALKLREGEKWFLIEDFEKQRVCLAAVLLSNTFYISTVSFFVSIPFSF